MKTKGGVSQQLQTAEYLTALNSPMEMTLINKSAVN